MTLFPKDHTHYPLGLCDLIMCQQFIYIFKTLLNKTTMTMKMVAKSNNQVLPQMRALLLYYYNW